MLKKNDIKIVIVVNKKDVWFCRICIASIRYYYPEIEIFLLKDELNGTFCTKEIEKYWQIGIINLEIKKFGWSAAKLFLYTDPRFKNQNLFVIDSDIIFIGNVLSNFQSELQDYDVFVSSEPLANPYENWVKDVYFDVEKIQKIYPEYTYPGYFFNAGQLLIKGCVISRKDLLRYFDFDNFPFWKKLDIFPLVDQSLFNFLFPIMQKNGRLRINSNNKYMKWSADSNNEYLKLNNILQNHDYPFLIHWAGDVRTPYLTKMNLSDFLVFFEKMYYQKIPFGNFKRNFIASKNFLTYYKGQIIRNIKDIVKNYILNEN